jgi:hypothetical protein
MLEPRRLTTLWASTVCYRDSFTFFNMSRYVFSTSTQEMLIPWNKCLCFFVPGFSFNWQNFIDGIDYTGLLLMKNMIVYKYGSLCNVTEELKRDICRDNRHLDWNSSLVPTKFKSGMSLLILHWGDWFRSFKLLRESFFFFRRLNIA